MASTHSLPHPRPSLNPSCLLIDIGGVLLTDGWDHHARKRAAKKFKLDWLEMEGRHRGVFATFEQGLLTLDEYLSLVIFNSPRKFTRTEFRRFIFAQSKAFPKMVDLVSTLKRKYNLRVIALNNEAREINAFRIKKFRLRKLIDFFVSSCFVHTRKPDIQIFRMALDLAQIPIEDIVYLENTRLFVDVAISLGIPSIHHTNLPSTVEQLSNLGLSINKISNFNSISQNRPARK